MITSKRSRARSRIIGVATAFAIVGAASGCSVAGRGIYDAPLPGGPDLGPDPYTVTAQFSDVLDLVPQSIVKVDNVTVGKVTDIRLDQGGRSATVTMRLSGGINLPANASARIEQSSMLGEKFVALARPAKAAAGSLRAARAIQLAGTSQAVEIEQVLGALSLLLNGGGLAQIRDISRELSALSSGRSTEIRSFLENTNSIVTTLSARRESITAAIDGMNELSRTLDANQAQIVTALDTLPPGLKVLVDQRSEFVGMLKALDELSKVSVTTLTKSKDDMVADLALLEPILTRLADAGANLPNALQILLTYPFSDAALGAIKGDYFNTFLVTSLSTPGTDIPAVVSPSLWPQVATAGDTPLSQIAPPPMMLPPTSSVAPGLPNPTVTVPTPTVPVPGTGTPSGGPTPSGTPTTPGTPGETPTSPPPTTTAPPVTPSPTTTSPTTTTPPGTEPSTDPTEATP